MSGPPHLLIPFVFPLPPHRLPPTIGTWTTQAVQSVVLSKRETKLFVPPRVTRRSKAVDS